MNAPKATTCPKCSTTYRAAACPVCAERVRGFPGVARVSAPPAPNRSGRPRGRVKVARVEAVRADPPKAERQRRASWETEILDTLRAEPGVWFRVVCAEDPKHASSLAYGARKRNPVGVFEFLARGPDVYARKLKPAGPR